MSNVIDLQAARRKRTQQFEDPLYQKRIDRMDMPDLLEEMIKYHEQNPKDKSLIFSMIRGIILFTALAKKCHTEEMRLLSSSYARHLQHEIQIKRSKK